MFSIVLLTTAVLSALFTNGLQTQEVQPEGPSRVDFTLGVMSRCPDALFTETFLDPIIEKTNDKINLQLIYIGQLDSEADYGVKCMHGDQECAGNIHQLCISHLLSPSRAGSEYDLSPSDAQRKIWDFIQCEDYDGIPSIGSIALAQQCTNSIKVPSWKEVHECINGGKGVQLLKSSVQESIDRSIRNSATIQIEGETVCIRDGGQWKECQSGHEVSDFVRLIEQAYQRKNPSL
ncbi:unnamed protein product [Sympodiomycopsis kandeliae]